jgi:uncharacterized protein (TIGR01777 family)
MARYFKRSELDVSADELFAWHARPGAFERLGPPWERLEIVSRSGTIQDGDRLVFHVKQGPLKLLWVARHEGYVPGRQFRDVMERGPFSRWAHTHRFVPLDSGGCALEDEVEYALPMGAAGELVAGWFVRRIVERMFEVRHRRTIQDMSRHQKYAGRERLKVAITGASGLVGRALVPFLTTGGHTVHPLVRRDTGDAAAIRWAPDKAEIEGERLAGLDAVVHLAGENIGGKRWTPEFMREVKESRVKGTRLIAQALANLPSSQRPRVLVSASAVGFYGDRGEEAVTEHSGPGKGFLAEVCQAWEEAAEPARQAGVRVVHPRIGLVLSGTGGALEKMLTLFRLGAGGRLGSGAQYMSWIVLDDLVYALHHLLWEPLEGPVNAVSPKPVTNTQFTKVLGEVLGRPTILPAPAFALKLAMGAQMAEELLLSSQRVLPTRLEASGFTFDYAELGAALRHVLGS